MNEAGNTILSRLLGYMNVPHTAAFSDRQFGAMTFKSLFGLSHLLHDYGVDNVGLRIADKTEIATLDTPFLAQGRDGVFSIVTDIDRNDNRVTCDRRGAVESSTIASFLDGCNGIVLLVFPDKNSCEPDYTQHRVQNLVQQMSIYALIAVAAIVFVYFFVTRHIYSHVSTILITIFDCAGLYLSYLLLQKSLGIRSHTGDRVCGIIERGGCDHIVSLSASKLFGVFSWSEVGFGYFGISLATLLLFPHLWPALALCNVCCLPYTVWSVWYQRFRARRWCTLCLGVQCTLWMLFFCYLGGGWLGSALPLRADIFVLAATYISAVLLLNLILRIFKNLPCNAQNQNYQ